MSAAPPLVWDGRRNPDWHPSLIALRDVQEHTRRRRIWNKAFSTAAVKEYEPIVVTRALQLVDELEKRSGGEHGGTVDLAKWMSFFTCVMLSISWNGEDAEDLHPSNKFRLHGRHGVRAAVTSS